MWGSRDPSWFQESIGVQKGRVNVYLLPWCDRVLHKRKDWLASQLSSLCVCARSFLNFCSSDSSASAPYTPIYSCYGVTIPPSDSTDKWFSLCNQFWRASWLQEHEEDACNCCRLFSIWWWRSILLIKEIFFSNGHNVFSFSFFFLCQSHHMYTGLSTTSFYWWWMREKYVFTGWHYGNKILLKTRKSRVQPVIGRPASSCSSIHAFVKVFGAK